MEKKMEITEAQRKQAAETVADYKMTEHRECFGLIAHYKEIPQQEFTPFMDKIVGLYEELMKQKAAEGIINHAEQSGNFDTDTILMEINARELPKEVKNLLKPHVPEDCLDFYAGVFCVTFLAEQIFKKEITRYKMMDTLRQMLTASNPFS